MGPSSHLLALPCPAPAGHEATRTHQGKLVDLHVEPLHLAVGHGHALLGLQVVAQPLQLGLPRRVEAVIDFIHTWWEAAPQTWLGDGPPGASSSPGAPALWGGAWQGSLLSAAMCRGSSPTPAGALRGADWLRSKG